MVSLPVLHNWMCAPWEPQNSWGGTDLIRYFFVFFSSESCSSSWVRKLKKRWLFFRLMIPRLIVRRCLTGTHNKIRARRLSKPFKRPNNVHHKTAFHWCPRRLEFLPLQTLRLPAFTWTLSSFWYKRRACHATYCLCFHETLSRWISHSRPWPAGYGVLLGNMYVIVCIGADFPDKNIRIWRSPWLFLARELSQDWVSYAVIGPLLLPTDHLDHIGRSRDYYYYPVSAVHN